MIIVKFLENSRLLKKKFRSAALEENKLRRHGSGDKNVTLSTAGNMPKSDKGYAGNLLHI